MEIMKNNSIVKKWFQFQFEGFLCLIRLGFFLFDFIFVIFFFGGGGGRGWGWGVPIGSLDTGSSYNCCILSDNIQEIR